MISIFLDTSFLITLADSARPHHEVAKQYLRAALKQGTPLYFSAIVASEFQVKQSITDLPLRNFNVVPFNIDHAMTAGNLMRLGSMAVSVACLTTEPTVRALLPSDKNGTQSTYLSLHTLYGILSSSIQ